MEAMSESCGGEQSRTLTEQQQQPGDHGLTLRLTRPRGDRRVVWTSDTIDNEHLGRRSSKCCCVYQKPRDFGESSSDSESEEGGSNCGNAHCPHGHAHSHPDSSHIHPDSSHIHPDSSHIHPDSSHIHPDSSHSHPDSAHIHTDSSHIHPDSAHIHPDSAHIHPDSSHIHPDSAHIHPDSSHIHPDSAHIHPDSAHIHPDSAPSQAGHPHSLSADDTGRDGGRPVPVVPAVVARGDDGATGGAGHANGQQ
ncbi:splicing factor 3A subunit 2-like isoform X2 [Lethenteron reissneri]|uniref:splicing factor 3A subunit 2-like n=1 Tax=Lethenteron reissneri TaxID=7753 RepID=UPI002AB71E0B|nr:splicing factor 3A subunit 2-like [Lethenteron reissneri]XP_061434812.1 splicing factor 3A subunit 2-like isoform X2 [Lethenteron reissneri]